MQSITKLTGSIFFLLLTLISSCKKSDPAPIPANPCASTNITITTTTTSNTPCATADGSITVTASGSSGYTYSINGGAFQTSNVFSGLAAGTYNITAKDGNGCSAVQSASISNAAAGPNFTNVKNIITANCANCHLNGNSNGSVNFDNNCTIVSKWDRINARCVTLGNMPPQGLTANEKSQITAWINAGHRYID